METRKESTDNNIVIMEIGTVNPGFEPDDVVQHKITTIDRRMSMTISENVPPLKKRNSIIERVQWDNGIEFLMSCIAMSVGLGNIWRFPFTAYENGGGAFLVPYFIVVAVVGRPLYYMEMALGQFASQGSVKVWEISPALRGVGWGQIVSTGFITTYYISLMALTLYYFFASMSADLPWALCYSDWDNCFNSRPDNVTRSVGNATGLRSSSEIYFTREVLHEVDNIENGIGAPDLMLTLYLFLAWASVFFVIIRGVKSSGKASYFLALFPYVVLTCLLIRGVTLPGALNGIKFFIVPEWSQLLNPKVWYAAVTQAFFSLGICFGALITYSSYNNFNHNIYRDAAIVTVLDTATSLIAGITIFSILGNLAYESGTDDISTIVKGGTGLAFISYPEAIAKFTEVPQIFSVLFFFMLYILGIGSAISCQGSIITVITDQYPQLKHWKVALVTCVIGFLIGLVYCTPGGQFILNLVDYYAGSFIVFVMASVEVIGINWIYGLDNFCLDLEFMLNRKVGIYWRLCWGLFTPLLLIIIFIYSVVSAQPLTYNDILYPTSAYAAGTLIMILGIIQLPIWAVYACCQRRNQSMGEMIKSAFQPTEHWGPKDPNNRKEWEQYKRKQREEIELLEESPLQRLARVLLGFNTAQQSS